jgi:hypothetical protein
VGGLSRIRCRWLRVVLTYGVKLPQKALSLRVEQSNLGLSCSTLDCFVALLLAMTIHFRSPSIVQIRPQILLGAVQIDTPPRCIFSDLILTDTRHAEIFGLGMAEIEAADGCRW